MPIIGIDLGTSNSAAAVLRGGRPITIPSAEGVTLSGKAFPSYVAFTAEGQLIVGEVVDAVLGADIDVPTLDGHVSVRVPAGAQPDATLRLRGKGLPRFGGGERGDLYVRLQLHIPERLSDRQRRLFEQLRDIERRKTSSHA